MAALLLVPALLSERGFAQVAGRDSLLKTTPVHPQRAATATSVRRDGLSDRRSSAAPQNLQFRLRRVSSVVGAEVFLQGNYVEVGIHSSGSFGTSGDAPAGFHPLLDGGGKQLGFVVDPGQDGWDVGVPPQSGDYFLPGAPEEGWAVEWTVGEAERTFGNFGERGVFDVPQTSLTETSSGDTRSAVWEGTATNGEEKLRITQTVSFDVNDLFFVINVVLTNTGTVPLESLEYMRNVDPDQEEPLTGTFTTSNYVANQPQRLGDPNRPDLTGRPAGNVDTALVVAKGLKYGLTLGLGAIDSRAVVSTEGFSNRDPDAILDTPVEPTAASPRVADEAIVLAYDLGPLAPGQSVSIDYAYILNESDLAVALGQLGAVTILQPTGTVSGSNVLFQATTDDVPNTVQIEFFVAGQSIGVDDTPDAGGVFEKSFDSLTLPNGPATLKAVATFSDSGTAEKTTTVTVDNSGPPMAFVTPKSGQTFSKDNNPIEIEVLDPSQPPVRVSFFRETAKTGSIFLEEDTSQPFTSSFDVSDLPQGETVVIKAVGTDALDRVTTIQVSGTVSSNQPPNAVNDTTVTNEDTQATINVLANDIDADEDPITVAEITQPPVHGTAQIASGAATVIYTPQADFNGADSLRYSITDGEFADTALVVITVAPVNDAPAAANDTVTTDEDTPVEIAVLANDTDVDGDPMTIAKVTQGGHGAVTIVSGGPPPGLAPSALAANDTVVYTPDPDYYGPDQFTYIVEDGNGGADTAAVQVTVLPVNDAPVAANDTVTTDEDTPITIRVIANDTDIDGDNLTVTGVTQGGHGAVAIATGTSQTNGGVWPLAAGATAVTYSPEQDFNGVDRFTYMIGDGNGAADTAAVLVIVNAVNDPPAAVSDTASTDQGSAVSIAVLRNDSDVEGDVLKVSAVTQPGHGVAVIDAGDSTVTYSPDADFSGVDTFSYTVDDGHGGSASVAVLVVVRDRRAPGPPMNLTVSPVGWTNADTIVIRWKNPPDSSGIAGLKFTVDVPPSSNEDGFFVAGAGIDSVAIPTGPELRGTHTAYIWLVDGDGNSDFNKRDSVTVYYDDVPPVTVADIRPTGWYNGDARIRLTASDSLSGVEATFFKVDGGNVQAGIRVKISGEGRNHTLEYWSTDKAGNTEAMNRGLIHIDLTPPSGRATSAQITADLKIRVEYEASDNLSGVARVELWFRKDFSFWIRQTESYTTSPILFDPTFGEGTYSFIVTPVDSAGNREARGDTAEVSLLFTTTGVASGNNKVPKNFVLEQNYPNPFNPSTTLRYGLPKPCLVHLEIYNLLGQKVRTLVDRRQPAGMYTIQWDGRTDSGAHLPSGVYLFRLRAGSFVAVRKMVLVE